VSAAIRQIGGTSMTATFIQAIAASISAVVVWRCWRRRSNITGDLTLPVATILATPVAFAYDMPMLAAAGLLALHAWAKELGAFQFVDLFIILMTLLLPVWFLLERPVAPLAAVVIGLLLWRLASGRLPNVKPLSR
jgi:hypothetical protein